MFKKTLISLAVASSVGLTGCLSGGDEGANANPDYQISNPAVTGKTWPIFNPVTSQLPIPNDLIFDSVAKDGTFRVGDTSPPVTTALNSLSGASTIAPAVIQFNGQVDANSVVANQTVFLIEVAYASGDPVQGLSNGEPPTLELALSGPTAMPQFTADTVTLDGSSAIRIVPTQPLNPRKRYIAVVTTGVLDVNGDAIIQSPSYASLTGDEPLGTASLAAVRTLINRVWEPLAEAYFGAVGASLTADDVAISYSFTTSNDEKVLPYIAEPAAWFADQIEGFVKVSAAKSAVAGGASSYADVNTAVTAAYNAFPNIPASSGGTIAEKLPTLFGGGAPCEGLTGSLAVECIGVTLSSAPSAAGGFSDLLPTPAARTVTLDLAGTNDVALASAPVSAAAGGAGNVNLVQGTIELPYYLGTPSGTNGTPLVTESWTADSGLAATMNYAFSGLNLVIPQADPSVSDVVNYIFPFPEGELQEAPVLVLYPSSGDVSGGTVIYQHGITTDRSAALSFGSALVSTLAAMGTNVAVVAIDQPLHGVTPASQASVEGLATSLLQAGQDNGLPASLAPSDTTVAALIAGQLNLSFVMTATSQDAVTAQAIIDDVLTGGTSGDANLDAAIGFLGAAENTVATPGSTIPGIAATDVERHFNFYADDANQPTLMDFDPAVAAGEDESGSLFINLTNFLASRDNNRQGAVDLMNLRASLGNIDINGAAAGGTLDMTNVFFVGHSLGTINGSPFVAASNENQITLSEKTSDDVVAASLLTPGGGIVRLLENSETFAPAILGGLSAAAGLEQGDANLETYFNVLQATLDTVDPVNFSDNHVAAGTGILLSEIIGDTVIPNSAGEGETLGNAFIAPLAGTEPLALTLSANDVTAAGNYALPAITRYTAGTHGTPVSADNSDVFSEMVGQTIGMILSGGAGTTATDDTVIQQ
ncbi:hypothetical protein FWJ25_17045 [Marinobacter salinexigens]|uniref:Bacterial virulence factor lipase N-terminal domain-containing protein n=1 Tax=Marinobacter salinexigens TaxID=2919747 RepID=A0A5B0V9J5_9GAMM|nr:hypothetical protein [Marinobacter salinexigens]KAA1171322.1 hypothetical protein FWJ25_17045 [Marinobacter salinexigens]